MASRPHANGRHFDLMALVIRGECKGPPSAPLKDLIDWGYVTYDGFEYEATARGVEAERTWRGARGPE